MRIQMKIAANRGYTADQVDAVQLSDLLEAVQDAILEWGEDAEVVLFQTNNGRGANYGELRGRWGSFFEAVETEADEEGDW